MLNNIEVMIVIDLNLLTFFMLAVSIPGGHSQGRSICVLFDAIRKNVENQGVGCDSEILLD